MAQKIAKMTFKTPLAPLLWVNISGKGKKKYDPQNTLDDNDPSSFQYTATARLTKAQADAVVAQLKEFWKNNKPAGATSMKYDLVKPELEKVLDKDGRPVEDEDGNPVTKETGFYLMQAKTITQWEDGKPNVIKTLRANGQPLDLHGKVIGDGSEGVIHGTIGVNAFKGNEGLNFYLTGVQLKKFVEYTGTELEADDLGEDEGLDDLDLDEAISGPAI
ncbi:MAG: hypothetical protein JHC33_11095 [Ignisphaera sp.]|nr:hypothetical protein [Ignisphaera sp.]